MSQASVWAALQKEPPFSTHEGSASQGGNMLGPPHEDLGHDKKKKKKKGRRFLLYWPEGLAAGRVKGYGFERYMHFCGPEDEAGTAGRWFSSVV